MSVRRAVLGIDTSNYTTSASILDTEGGLIANIKRPLPVREGECGLRQSDAVFAHIKNIPSVMDEARSYLSDVEICAVGVSEKPRNQDGSYMPCFLSGVAVAESISASLGAPLYRFSHQCGHIMAALYSSGAIHIKDAPFGAFHVSGGTTELVLAEHTDSGFRAEIVGGANDLNAGQAIDRVGVLMGLRFPAGAEMEALASAYQGKVLSRKPSVSGTFVNLSGLENMAAKLYRDTGSKEAVSAFVLNYISQSLRLMAHAFREERGNLPLVFAGGVMSNRLIKESLKKELDNVYFAEPALSADNAVGIAVLTLDRFKR